LLTACLSFGIAAAWLASQPSEGAVTEKPARKCLEDLRAYDTLLQKNGYWLHGSGYGYDHPMEQHGYGVRGTAPSGGTIVADEYWHARPGYEVRTLIAAANVLAQRGQQQSCEALLTAARDIYSGYAAEPREVEALREANGSDRRKQQIAAAQPVGAFDDTLRADQLIGTEPKLRQGVTGTQEEHDTKSSHPEVRAKTQERRRLKQAIDGICPQNGDQRVRVELVEPVVIVGQVIECLQTIFQLPEIPCRRGNARPLEKMIDYEPADTA